MSNPPSFAAVPLSKSAVVIVEAVEKQSSSKNIKPPGIDRSKLSSSNSKDKALKKSGENNPKKPKV
jgi:hypothetical protein